MLRILFAVFVSFHAIIHTLGFAKAFHIGNITQLAKSITKPVGIVWLIAAVLLFIAVLLFLIRWPHWWAVAIPAVLLSQILIITAWPDAKYGTIANLLMAIAILFQWGLVHFEKSFTRDVATVLTTTSAINNSLITEEDLATLPNPVKRYLQNCGVVGKPRIHNMRVVFSGQMRRKKMDWFDFTSVQYNFFEKPARYFFMKASMYGMQVPGYHKYRDAQASMVIRFAGLFPIVNKSGVAMNKAETVTLFNDMCLLAPATLIDKRIAWTAIDSNKTKATFTNDNITISAILHFDEQGMLKDFESNDRYDVIEGKQIPFFTPCGNYQTTNGYRIMHEGDAIWQYPEGKFTYGKFRLQSVTYNVAMPVSN